MAEEINSQGEPVDASGKTKAPSGDEENIENQADDDQDDKQATPEAPDLEDDDSPETPEEPTGTIPSLPEYKHLFLCIYVMKYLLPTLYHRLNAPSASTFTHVYHAAIKTHYSDRAQHQQRSKAEHSFVQPRQAHMSADHSNAKKSCSAQHFEFRSLALHDPVMRVSIANECGRPKRAGEDSSDESSGKAAPETVPEEEQVDDGDDDDVVGAPPAKNKALSPSPPAGDDGGDDKDNPSADEQPAKPENDSSEESEDAPPADDTPEESPPDSPAKDADGEVVKKTKKGTEPKENGSPKKEETQMEPDDFDEVDEDSPTGSLPL